MDISVENQELPQTNKYNILDIFLEIANESEDSSEQLGSFESSENTNENTENYSELQNYSKVKKSNIVKNILKSFQRYIEDASREEQVILCEVAKKDYCFSQLKKLIKRNFKTFGKRWNMKLKYLIQKCSYKGLFVYYLQHKTEEWLRLSKVQNKDAHKTVIEFLLKAIKNPEYCEEIKYYKKNKSTLSNE